jgi:hypothetical protein
MELSEKLKQLRLDYHTYAISLEEARDKAAPIIKALNERAEVVSNKFGRRTQLLTFEKTILK